MQTTFRLLLLKLACWLFSLPVAPAQRASLDRAIGILLREETPVDFTRNPTVLVGVIDGDSTYVLRYGEAIDTTGRFEIGSLSKPVTSWLFYSLSAPGPPAVADIPACAAWPANACRGPWGELTLGQLMTHRAGWPQWPPGIGDAEAGLDDPYRDFDCAALEHAIASAMPQPGRYSYSHLGYAALGPWLDRAGGYAALLDTVNARHDLDFTLADDHRVVQGHDLAGESAGPWHTNALAPALGVRASMSGMLAWLRHTMPDLVNECRASGWSKKLFKQQLKRESAYTVIRGWFAVPTGKDMALFHTGRTGGHHAAVALIPAKRKAVVVLGTGASGSGELCWMVLQLINEQ
jgi:CubicO group peptidase (beta-lactamase class C family)